jgi:DNA (cytosine-5)-methyltransferase 1
MPPLLAGTVRSHVRPGSNSSDTVTAGAAVRRLTPVECERLQGLPDGWTLEHGPSLADEPNFPRRTEESCPPPDSRRYAACGDAVTANVAEWIGRRLS